MQTVFLCMTLSQYSFLYMFTDDATPQKIVTTEAKSQSNGPDRCPAQLSWDKGAGFGARFVL